MHRKRKLIVNVTVSLHQILYSPLSTDDIEQKLQSHFAQKNSIITGTGMNSFAGKIQSDDTFSIRRLAHKGTSVYATGKILVEEEGSRLDVTFKSTIIAKVLAAFCILFIVLTLGFGIFIAGPFYALLSYAYQKEIELLESFFQEELQAVASSD